MDGARRRPRVEQSRGSLVIKTIIAVLISSLLIWIGLFVSPAFAQQLPSVANSPGGGDALEEVVVTARKQSEPLEKVPVAVSVVTAAQLRNTDSSDLENIAELTPTRICRQHHRWHRLGYVHPRHWLISERPWYRLERRGRHRWYTTHPRPSHHGVLLRSEAGRDPRGDRRLCSSARIRRRA